MPDEEEEQKLRDVQILEREVELANQRMKLELLKKKLGSSLETEADTAAQVVVVVVVIAQQLISYHRLSGLRKSATMAGMSHRSCILFCLAITQ